MTPGTKVIWFMQAVQVKNARNHWNRVRVPAIFIKQYSPTRCLIKTQEPDGSWRERKVGMDWVEKAKEPEGVS